MHEKGELESVKFFDVVLLTFDYQSFATCPTLLKVMDVFVD